MLNREFKFFKQAYINIQSGGSFSNQRIEGIITKHPQALIITIAGERAIVEALEQHLETMPDALKRRIQKHVRKIRKTTTKQKTDEGYVIVGKPSGKTAERTLYEHVAGNRRVRKNVYGEIQ